MLRMSGSARSSPPSPVIHPFETTLQNCRRLAEWMVSSSGLILPADTTRGNQLEPSIIIRPFTEEDAEQVRVLFIRVNRLLAPAHMVEAFEAYIAMSLSEEIGQISQYYERRQGGFWVAVDGGKVIGMFELEPSSPGAMELRRMYVHPDARRRGIARQMLSFAEDECRKRNRPRMDLSTSEPQRDALSLYRASGYQLVREGVAVAASNKDAPIRSWPIAIAAPTWSPQRQSGLSFHGIAEPSLGTRTSVCTLKSHA